MSPTPTIVIDAGHGGEHDVGHSSAIGFRGAGGTLEKDVNLALAQRVASHLGGRAVLTRSDDRNLSLGERCAIARRHGAKAFISLHAGGLGARGTQAFVHRAANPQSIALASAIREHVAAYGAPTLDTAGADLAVLSPRHLPSDIAACLVEIDELGDPQGEARLRDPRSLDEVARAIARAATRNAYGNASCDVPEATIPFHLAFDITEAIYSRSFHASGTVALDITPSYTGPTGGGSPGDLRIALKRCRSYAWNENMDPDQIVSIDGATHSVSWSNLPDGVYYFKFNKGMNDGFTCHGEGDVH